MLSFLISYLNCCRILIWRNRTYSGAALVCTHDVLLPCAPRPLSLPAVRCAEEDGRMQSDAPIGLVLNDLRMVPIGALIEKAEISVRVY